MPTHDLVSDFAPKVAKYGNKSIGSASSSKVIVSLLFQVSPLDIMPPWLDPMIFMTNLAWVLVRSFVTFLICFAMGLAGIKVLDRITPGIKEMTNIKGQPLPTALFATGMFIFLSLTFIGSVIAPLPIGVSSGMGAAISPAIAFAYRLVALLAGYVISLIFAAVFYRILARMEPFGIDLDDVDKSDVATGIYVMGYLVFLGVILYASLLIPA